LLQNYLAAAIRNLFRDRAYAAINIFGLALGFTAVLLIALYVRDEYTYDHQFPAYERTYRMYAEFTAQGRRTPVRVATLTANMAAALELDFPEVEFATRLAPGGGTLRQGDREVAPSFFFWADPDFFRMFPVKALAGDVNAALSRPDGLVLTRRMARQLFNREDVLGEAVTVNRQQTLQVAAVIEDLPSNTHLALDAVASGLASGSELTRLDELAAKAGPGNLQPESVYIYARLRPGASIEKLDAAMGRFAEEHFVGDLGDSLALSTRVRFSLINLPDIHFLPRAIADLKPPSDRRTVQGMMLIAAIILFVAASNFVSMMTARAARRAIEVGVRKAVGATRRQIIVQFLAECLFYSGLALAIALVAVWVLLPAFNGFLQRGIGFDFARDPLLAVFVVAGWLTVGLAAGAYPALVLSMFRPVTVLKGALSLPGGPGRLRQAMVILQFGTLVALIVATITVHRQTRFAIEEQLRVPGEQVLVVPAGCINGMTRLRDSIASLEGVSGASCVSGSALARNRFTMAVASEDGTVINVRASPVDATFFRLLDVQPIAGRLLDPEHGEDNVLIRPDTAGQPPSMNDAQVQNPAFVINESAARALGYANPREAVNQYRRWGRMVFSTAEMRILDPAASKIVGVVPDFSFGSIRDAIEPTGYYIDSGMTTNLLVKLDGARIPETMPAIEAEWRTASEGRPFRGQFVSQVLNDLYADILRQASLFSAFSAVAVVVASLGLLGLAVFTAERRTREIGVRKAMGASRSDILRFIGWQFARPVLIANFIAWPIAWLTMQRWLESFAYHVDLGPLAFLLASGLALLIALVTVAGHAMLVSRARPVEALRYE
jgi:putative ABC transport system permease protein